MYIYDDMCATGKNATKTHKSMKVIILSLLNSVYTEEFDENVKSSSIYENLFTIVLDDFKGIEIVQHLNEVNPITH